MKKNKLSYKESMLEIEEILSKIESREIDLDELTAHITHALELLSECKKKLKNSEDEVLKLLQTIEKE
jgi:exodeoxyribonuclease VII small subunit